MNTTTGVVTPGTDVVIYEGRGMYGDRLSGHPRDEGFADKREHLGVLRLPVDGGCDVNIDDEVLFLEGPLTDEVWEVVAEQRQTYQGTARFEIYKKESEVMRS